ncbi:MAG: methyltransferase [Paracoccaceae bacterium]
MTRPPSPYLAPGFYDSALAKGRHRDIVGGRWGETGRAQVRLLRAAGLQPRHRLLDIGCGSLRLGHLAVPFLDPGHYWGTDASAALMRRGREAELTDETRARLPPAHLVEDPDFAFPGIPADIDSAIAFAVFPHLPPPALPACLASLRARFPRLAAFLFTVFEGADAPLRQPDGVVTHPGRAPWHRPAAEFERAVRQAGFLPDRRGDILPRGQRLWMARPA